MESKILKILERNLPALTGLSGYEKSTFEKILNCRTETVPHLFSRCDNCGTVHPVYKSCKNRMCPICNGAGTVKWIAKRESELLPTSYFLLTYTIPSELKPLFLYNKSICYNLLFKAMSQTLMKGVESNNRAFHGRSGFFAVLHTWDQRLNYHLGGIGEQ
ncbi:MAG: transposase zinc-binding domain-containing protein [Spirochaetales bacterium]|nr:transposase zinc-binding domain-containing protein [Spirochaetales bacterium]